jgi:hypothetical protein
MKNFSSIETVVAEQALNPCPVCQNLCSVEATFCPKCGQPFAPATKSGKKVLDEKIFDQILMQSSMKVGMCLTLLGLIKVVEGVKSVSSFTDELLAFNALGFMLSSLFSYFALKEDNAQRKQLKGRFGDVCFSGSLALLVIICAILAFELL